MESILIGLALMLALGGRIALNRRATRKRQRVVGRSEVVGNRIIGPTHIAIGDREWWIPCACRPVDVDMPKDWSYLVANTFNGRQGVCYAFPPGMVLRLASR